MLFFSAENFTPSQQTLSTCSLQVIKRESDLWVSGNLEQRSYSKIGSLQFKGMDMDLWALHCFLCDPLSPKPKARSWNVFFSLLLLYSSGICSAIPDEDTCRNKGLFVSVVFVSDDLWAPQSSRAYETKLKISRKQYSNINSNIILVVLIHCQYKAMGIS